MNSESRAKAAFLGLAVGDALGAPVEFSAAGSFAPIVDYRAGGPWNLAPGQWTDDTSMAICLAESIIANNAIDSSDLLERFWRWYKFGENSSTGVCFDIGTTTLGAVAQWGATKKFLPAGNVDHLNTNGSLMRLAPVAVRWWNRPDMLLVCSRKQSLTTHGANECLDSCEQLALMMGSAIRGEPVLGYLQNWSAAQDPKSFDLGGRVWGTLHAAMWAVGRHSSFEQAVLSAVNMGGDTDTIGAVTGQLAGAIWGMESIPGQWLDQLYDLERLQNLAHSLWSASV